MKVIIEKQGDGTYIAYNTDCDGISLIGTGNTVNEAKEDFCNSIRETKEALESAGLDINPAFNEELSFKFDVASLFEYYNVINVSAFARSLGINSSLMRQYKKGGTYVSDTQLKKIEEGIHSLGNELSRLKLL